jgi:hypothetical protein
MPYSRATGTCLLFLLIAAVAGAGTVYRWVDENGVVHFGDVPPPGKRAIEQNLPAPPPRPAAAPAQAAAAGAGAATPATAATGPARVVIVDRDEIPLGGSRHAVSGKVKNEGGQEARGVAVAIRVVEPIQGEECLTDEIVVSPSTLAAGEEGSFSADFDHPCFYGPTQSELRVEWD